MNTRIENLKKIISPNLVDFYVFQSLQKTDSELDALYLAYYRIKSLVLKYNREAYGTINQIFIKPKKMSDFNKFINEYITTNDSYYTQTIGYYNPSYSTYYNTL